MGIAIKALQANVFLRPFVSDVQTVLQHGVAIGDKLYSIKIGAIICHAPTKAYILGIKGHNGYSSCTKCTTEGEFTNGRMCFAEMNAPVRTDASFRAEDEDHHVTKTILIELPIDIVQQFPLDYMHLICLGVVREILLICMKGDKSYRIGRYARESVSGSNLEIRHYVPSEISRKPQSLSDINKWKASEFRLFFLYTGPVVLRSKMPPRLFDNFMTLHCAIYILSSPSLSAEHTNFADRLLRHFV